METAGVTVPESELTDLYGLPLDRFTDERDKLARRMREAGQGEEAAEIAAMRKPTTDAWALNQVARRHSKLIERLLEAHSALREASESGGFSQASASRRSLVDQTMDAALAVLKEAGYSSSGPVRDRIARTLLAAAADPATEQALKVGNLVRPVEISGQWPESALAPPIPMGAQDEDDPGWAEEVRRLESEAQARTEEAETLRREANKAKKALRSAHKAAEAAGKAAETAEEAAKAARERAKSARDRRPHS